MLKGSPEPRDDVAPPAEEATPVNYKKITLILLAAIVCGLGVGVAGALALRESSAPAASATAEAAPATALAALAPVPAVKMLEPAAPTPMTAPAAPAPTEGTPSVTAGEPSATPAPSAGPVPIPVLTGAEIKERYNVTRFVDKETDQLCYLAEPRSSGLTGSLDCGPRPTHVPASRGE